MIPSRCFRDCSLGGSRFRGRRVECWHSPKDRGPRKSRRVISVLRVGAFFWSGVLRH